MIICRTIDTLIQRGLDGRLSPTDRAALDAHLSECAACRHACDEYHALSRTASAWAHDAVVSADPGRAFTERVMARLALEPVAQKRHITPRSLVFGFLSMLLLTVVSAWVGSRLPTGVLSLSLRYLVPHDYSLFTAVRQIFTVLPQAAREGWNVFTMSLPAPARWMWSAMAAAVFVNVHFVREARRKHSEAILS